MCIKVGDNELSSVKALMSMSLGMIIVDTFDMEPEELKRGMHLKEDMGMDTDRQSKLSGLVAEYFNGLQLDFRQIKTVDDLFQLVVDQEFTGFSAYAI